MSLAYMIHEHAATSLHYDFRLELGGVLLSWAVPKGPSLDPRHKRLAMRVGDHALEHAAFEGLYERGGAIIWDAGTWEPAEGRDAQADLRRGRMSFVLHGKKLRGAWHLVRRAADSARESWVLFKGADAEARRTGSIVEAQPKSVVSGLTLDELLATRQRARDNKVPCLARHSARSSKTPHPSTRCSARPCASSRARSSSHKRWSTTRKASSTSG